MAIGFTSICFAQQVGLRDFTVTSWRAPADHVSRPTREICPVVNSTVSDGAIVQAAVQSDQEEKERVQLVVVDVTPTVLQIGGEFQARVRFENLGKTAVRVPWETDGERVTHMSADGKEESYEVVDINLRLGTDIKHGSPAWLKAAGVLFARSDGASGHLDLPAGSWAEIRIKGKLTCGQSGVLCKDFEPDEKAELSAWWYEREMTHRVDGCKEDHGSYVIRELDSKPLLVVVRRSPPK